MEAHNNIGGISMDTPVLKIGGRVFEKKNNVFPKSIKFSKAPEKNKIKTRTLS